MTFINGNTEILSPKKQRYLYGYNNYFNLFVNIYSKKKLPKVSLITGQKGIGKSTFVYHFSNFLLSKNENNNYSLKDKSINANNKSYKNTLLNIHPNFYLIDKKNDHKNIGIDEIRKLSDFLNKTTYLNNLKIVMIDNAEFLNINSANALLKILEDSKENTYFFIIHNNLLNIQPTIKSRSILFRIFFDHQEKKDIFSKLLSEYNKMYEIENISDFLFYDTPGNLLKYLSILDIDKNNINENFFRCIFFYMQKYQKDKNNENLFFISFFIEKYYNYLISNTHESCNLFLNKSEIINKINLLKKYNLDNKNIFIYIKNILQNEKK